jgi:hypothetical protein
MVLMTRRFLLAIALLVPTHAFAERRIAIDTPVEAFTRSPARHAGISHVLYLERCRGGCTVTKSNTNDAKAGLSTIPQSGGVKTITEFQSKDGLTGGAADAEWAELVQCMREVYSPFDVEVTDVKPVSGITYHQAVIAGFPSELGFGSDILGVAPLASNCAAQDNVMSFSFANAHGPTVRIENLCWTAAQESAHAFGLDHSFKFTDGRSTCNDPMTYQVDCGGEHFFRNQNAKCGEFNERACRCGSMQNSHTKLLAVFGAGTPITGNPTSTITTPMDGQQLGVVVGASAGSKRGVAKVELLVNNFPWAETKGALFGPNGQANPAPYGLMIPSNLPDGVCDFVARAYDDLGAFTDSAVVTRTKGAPCTSSATCAQGQSCEVGTGKCQWPAPVGEIGDSCEYAQFCKSLKCVGGEDSKICTISCNPEDANICPNDLTCIETTSPQTGVCYHDDGGCCSVSFDRRVPWPHIAFATFVLGLLMRRRRARK